MYNLNYNREIELVGSIPSPLFHSNEPIPANTEITLTYIIDNNNYHTNLINYAGSFSGGVGTKPTIIQMDTKDCNNGVNNCIAVGILDFYLLLYCEPANPIVDRISPYDFVNYSSIRKTLNNNVSSDSQQFNFAKNRRINFIALAFTQNRQQKQSLSDFGIPFDEVLTVANSSAGRCQ